MTRDAKGGVTVRLARPGDEHEMLEVLTAAFAGWPRFDIPVAPVDHLRWKMQPYDAGLPCRHVVAEAGSRIASVRLHLMRRVLIGGNQRLLVMHSTIATHPDFQGRGIYNVLRSSPVAIQADEVDVSLGWTENPVVVHIASEDDSRRALESKVLVKVLDIGRMTQPNRTSEGRLRRNPLVRALAFRGFKIARRLRRVRPQPAFEGEVARVACFDERFDAFWGEARQGFGLIGERSSAFLTWRYADERGGDHVVFAAQEDGRVLGYIATWANEGRGQILDLLALPGRNDVARSLIARADDFFTSSGLYAAECRMAARNRYEALFAEQGFVDPRRSSNFYYMGQRLTPAEQSVIESKASEIHLMDGDL